MSNEIPTVVVTVEGGLVQDVSCPPGVNCKVIDFDCDETEGENVHMIDDVPAWVCEYHGEGSPLLRAAPAMFAALKRLLVDAWDRGETRNEETGEEYDDWKQARLAYEAAKAIGEEVRP